jgi:hypothetical protein
MSEPRFAPMPTIPPETQEDRNASAFVTARLGFVSPAYHAEVVERLRAENERLKSALGQVAALGDFCEECDPTEAPPATYLTTHVLAGIPIFLCAEHAEEAREAHRKAESKGCGAQPNVVEHEQDTAVVLALAALNGGDTR